MTSRLFHFYALRCFLWSVDTLAVQISILTSCLITQRGFLKTTSEMFPVTSEDLHQQKHSSCVNPQKKTHPRANGSDHTCQTGSRRMGTC